MIFWALPARSPTTKLSWATQILRVMNRRCRKNKIAVKHESNDYVIAGWLSHYRPSALRGLAPPGTRCLQPKPQPTPFMRHEYLAALHASGSATPPPAGRRAFYRCWSAMANWSAPARSTSRPIPTANMCLTGPGPRPTTARPALLPQSLVAVPFTPVPGTRLMARTPQDRAMLAKGLMQWCEAGKLSSLHLLFADSGGHRRPANRPA